MAYKLSIEDSNDYITVATTRPETLFGDMAIAVNPNDSRYKSMIGKYALLPFVNRKLPIIGDEYVDMDFGTGCLKITPVMTLMIMRLGKNITCMRRMKFSPQKNIDDFKPINIFNDDAWTNENVPEPFNDLDRFKVRKLAIKELDKLKLLVDEEEYDISVPRGERSNIVIEPRLSNQWYVKTLENGLKRQIKKLKMEILNFIQRTGLKLILIGWTILKTGA